MKHQHCRVAGNSLMVLGLVTMVLGVGFSIINQLPTLDLPQFLAQGAILSIFIGALMWLVGARISGREKVEDRYYWLRHYDKRCRRSHNSHH
ncbi:stress-induced protein YchH [Pantoea sp. B550]|uniref:stress-induced protein YchH n=1 Tax=Pantoea sp. B550 TaxID=2959338 RepID=UPI00209C8E0E|nr:MULTISPECIES: stress-induced protein YchH [Pantoea]MCP1207749.1 stress-induced protein YchH [Pantoea sp. B550]WIL40601.1 stress-induced protein YchH [Pantoea agglomerans]